MRAIIISDTHGALQRSELALRQMEPFDLIIHAGDHWQDGQWLANFFDVALRAVAGNCDGAGYPERLSFRWAGLSFFLSHGHRQGVNNGFDLLLDEAWQQQAEIVIYGHTHCSHMESIGSLLLFNPGSPAHPRGSLVTPHTGQPTIGCINVEEQDVTFRLISIYDGATVKELSVRH